VTATAAAPSPAVAPPPGSPRFALFDSFRAIAVLCIIGFHVASITGELNKAVIGDVLAVAGNTALILFFVVSGFLLYRPYVAARAAGRPRPSTARYLRRRVLRIVPVYWVALSVLGAFPGIVGVFGHDWWRYYFFGQLYSHRTLGGGIPVAWSLCVEVTFYTTLPLWAMAVRRVRVGGWLAAELAPLAAVALVGIAIQLAAARQAVSYLVAQSLLGECTWLALGMALAVASVAVARSERESRLVRAIVHRPGLCWLGAGACQAGLTALLHPGGLLNIIVAVRTQQSLARTLAGIVLTAAVAALLVLPAVFGERAGGLPRRVLAWRPLAWLGLVSYGVYLWHLAVVQVLGLSSDPAHFSATGLGLVGKIHHLTTPILYVMALAGSAALAAVSYYVVELPFLRRKER
jgi:peptidoglycan/LPS O-acetylase OafA/YrhL